MLTRLSSEATALSKSHIETGLPVEPRLKSVELPRTTGQLRQAARAVREQDWCRATIDTASNIRSVHGPLGGPVIVFGPNNFPYAFNGVSGGDFAAAIAAGNPVIAKAHPAHPHTSTLLAEAAVAAMERSGMPKATVQMFFRAPPDLGKRLVSHPITGGAAFTGGRFGGTALKEAADAAGKPIYLEMSSVNPVVFLNGALRERGDSLAAELNGSCALGAGQFCTKPGLAIVQSGPESDAFLAKLTELTASTAPGTLLTPNSPKEVEDTVSTLQGAGAEVLAGGKIADVAAFAFEPTLLTVSGDRFLEKPEKLQSEAFGSVCLVVVANDLRQMQEIAASLEGNLTGSIYSDTKGSDDGDYDAIASVLRAKVGRLLNDKMPTGVAVSPAMNHGGPFPATGHPCFTAVGIPASIIRFSALHCYDAVRENRLPNILKNKNPTGSIVRFIDGSFTTDDIQ